jgi:hypothetical protein
LVAANHRSLVSKRRLWMLQLKNILGCSTCEESDPDCLDFHHLDPTTKECEISNMVKRSEEVILCEVNKCIVLCANCHRKLEAQKRRVAEAQERFFILPGKGGSM